MTAALAALGTMAAGRGRMLLLVSLLGWAAMLTMGLERGAAGLCGAMSLPALRGGVETMLRLHPVALLLEGWTAMIAAMMAPLLWQPLEHVRLRSLARRRHRALALFAAGYGGSWLLACAGLWLAAAALQQMLAGYALPAALGVALGWQGTPAKALALRRCHARPPLAVFGLAAEWASLRYGIEAAAPCIGACWALMLLPFAAGAFALPAMIAVAAGMLAERYGRLPPPGWRRGRCVAGTVLAAVAVGVGITG